MTGKMLRGLSAAFLAAFFYVGTALAQNPGTVTNHAFMLGKGPGVTGYTSLLCGSAQLAVGQSAADPICRTLTGDVTLDAAGVTYIGSLKVVTGMIANNAVTLAKLATIANNRALCNVTGGASTPVECTATQLTTLVNAFTVSLSGAVPAPGTATNKFLRDDGTWQAVAGAGTVTNVATAGIVTGGPITTTGTLNVNATITPQHRITLVSGLAVMTSTVSAATSIVVTPSTGNLIPMYDGTNFIPTAFAETSQLLTDTTKSPAAAAASTIYDVFCWLDTGPTGRCTRGPAWSNSGASTSVRGTGAGSSELVRVSGIYMNAQAITNGPAAQRGVYMGSCRTNASSQIDYSIGGSASGGVAGNMNCWNMYNRVPSVMNSIDTGAPYGSPTATNQQARGSANNQNSFLIGVVEDAVDSQYFARTDTPAVASAFCIVGIGINSTSAYATRGYSQTVSAGVSIQTPSMPLKVYPAIGYQGHLAIENSVSASCSFNGDSKNTLTTAVWN